MKVRKVLGSSHGIAECLRFLHGKNVLCEEKDLSLKFIKTLLCDEKETYFLSSESHISPLLHRNSLFMAYTGNFDVTLKEAVIWTKVDFDECLSKMSQWKIPENRPNIASLVDAKPLSETLHLLADELPIQGTYKMDVLISYKSLTGMNVCGHMDLASSLYRLCKWHNALLSVIKGSQSDDVDLLDWQEVVDFQVINEDKIHEQVSTLWRGCIRVGDPDNQNSTNLPGFHLGLDAKRIFRNWSFMKSTIIDELEINKCKDAIIISSKMDVLEECDIATIPLHMISPFVFQLSINNSYKIDSKALDFIDFLKQNPRRCFVLRLQYSKINLPHPKTTYTAEKWRKAVLSGNIDIPEPELLFPKMHLTFILTKHFFSSESLATAYLMCQSSKINTQFYHQLCEFSLPLTNELANNAKEKITMNFKNIPHLQCNIAKCVKDLEDIQIDVFCNQTVKEKENTTEAENSTRDIKAIFNEISDAMFCKLVQNIKHSKSVLNIPDPSFEEETLTDPSDWPERIYLLQQQILRDRNKRHHSETLGGLAPPLSQNNTISISAEDIANYFMSSGAAKCPLPDSTKALSVIQRKNHLSFCSPNRLIQAKWPEVLQVDEKDIYYNYNNSCEEKEARSCRIRDRYVTCETASTCNNQQSSLNCNILHVQNELKKKSSEIKCPGKMAETHIKRKSPSPDEGIYLLEGSKRKKTNFAGSVKIHNKRKLIDNKQCTERESTELCCSPSVSTGIALRRSPRKHLKVNYKQSPYHRKPATKNLSVAPQMIDDLSEHHRLKLRDAVAMALELYGITFNHPDFKSCGKKLFAVCKAFTKDIIGKGNTTAQMQKIAQAHVKQVVEFEMQKQS